MELKHIAEKDLRDLYDNLHEEYLNATYGGITSTFAEIRYVRVRDELMEVIEEMERRRKLKAKPFALSKINATFRGDNSGQKESK